MRGYNLKSWPVWRKGLVRLLMGILILLLISGTALVALLGSQSGRLWLLDTGVAIGLGDGPVQITFENARSPSLGEWSFARITVTRQQDTWLDIQQLHMQWQPWELLQKRILINTVRAGQLDINLNADTPDEEPPEPTPDTNGGLPAVAVESFELGRLRLTDDRRNLPEYQISGDLRLFWEAFPFRINLLAESLPQPDEYTPMRLEINSTAQPSNQLRLEGSLLEHAGGQLGQLLRLPATSGIDASFAGVVRHAGTGYAISLEKLQLPFLHRQLGAAGEISVDGEFKRLFIDSLSLTTDEQEHQLSGSLSAEALDLRLHADEFPLDLLSPWVEQLSSGSISADLHATGSPNDPRVVGTASATSEYRQQPITIDTEGFFSRRRLDFDHLTFRYGVASLQANGLLDLAGTDTSLQFSLRDFPSDYLALAELDLVPDDVSARLVSAEGSVTGDYRDPSGQLTATAEGTFRQRKFELNLDARGTRQRVSLASSQLLMGDASLHAEGVLDIEGDQSDLNLNLDSMPLELLELAKVELPEELATRISGSANVTGALASPRVKGRLEAYGSYRQQAFTAGLHGSGNRDNVVVQRAWIGMGAASVEADGTANFSNRTADFEVALDNAALSLLELARIEVPDGLTAKLSGWASLTGTFDAPLVNSQLQAVGDYQELPFLMVANGSLLDRRLQIDRLQLDLDDVTALEIQGYLQPDVYDLRLTANNLPSQTFSALGWDLVTGEFNANLRVQGTPDRPNIGGTLSYSGDLTGLDLATGEKTTFDLGWRTQLATEEQVLQIDSSFSRDQRNTGKLHLSLPITRYLTHIDRGDAREDFPLAFSVDGALDLAILSLLLDPDIHRIHGRAAMRLEGSGSLAQPNVTGILELLNGGYENTLSGTLLSDVQLLLKSSGTRVTIAEASARGSGKGQLQAEGWVDWLNTEREDAINVGVSARNANLLDREDLDGEVSGELSLTGSFHELWLRGQLDVTPFAANIDAALQNQIPEIEVTEVYGDSDETAGEEALGSSLAPTIHLDLTIKADQQAFLRGRGLDAELAGEIHLGGTLTEPNYEGEFSIVRGVFEVFGRKFNLLQGEVLFANNALYMLIPGEYQQDDHTIRAELSGTVDDLSLSLTSVPDLPEDEILSRLIFGKSAQNITPFQAIRLATAIQTLRGGGGFDPVGSTRDVLGVDTLSLESASTDTGTGVSIGVGKYINERVYLEVERTPSETQPWQASVQIELSSRLQLRSTAGGEGRTGAELLWRRDY